MIIITPASDPKIRVCEVMVSQADAIKVPQAPVKMTPLSISKNVPLAEKINPKSTLSGWV